MGERESAPCAELSTRAAAAFEERLRTTGNALLDVDGGLADLRNQARTVVEDVAAGLGVCPPGLRPSHDALSAQIGVRRASDHVDPVESVRAAALLFEVTLPLLVDGLARWEPDPTAIAHRLNHAVLERVAVGSVSFGAFLLSKVHTSHVEERRRMARELHDRVAHSVAVALQQLELAEVYAQTDQALADEKLVALGTALRATLDDVRGLSRDIRETVLDEGGLDRALDAFLSRRAGAVHTELTVTGDCAALPAVVAEELYVVLREAIRNALAHSGGTRLRVSVDVGPVEVVGRVTDDGRGFVPGSPVFAPDHGLGIVSMRERIDLLGGTLTIDSGQDAGTVLSVLVPLRRGTL